MKIHNFILSIVIIFTSTSLLAYERIPNEQFACYSNFNKMMVSPDGRYLLIRNTVKNNECDVEKEKEKVFDVSYRSFSITSDWFSAN